MPFCFVLKRKRCSILFILVKFVSLNLVIFFLLVFCCCFIPLHQVFLRTILQRKILKIKCRSQRQKGRKNQKEEEGKEKIS